MKKKLIYIAAISLGLFVSSNAIAADFTVTAADDGAVTMASNAANDGPAFRFIPSTNIVMDGGTTAAGESFVVSAYHTSVLAKSSGKGFGMASDTNAMYWIDLSASGAAATLVAVGTPWDSTQIQTANWKSM